MQPHGLVNGKTPDSRFTMCCGLPVRRKSKNSCFNSCSALGRFSGTGLMHRVMNSLRELLLTRARLAGGMPCRQPVQVIPVSSNVILIATETLLDETSVPLSNQEVVHQREQRRLLQQVQLFSAPFITSSSTLLPGCGRIAWQTPAVFMRPAGCDVHFSCYQTINKLYTGRLCTHAPV